MANLQITPSPLYVYAARDQQIQVRCNGDPIYYKATADVTSTSYDGTISDGQSVSLAGPNYFVTARTLGNGKPGSAALLTGEFVGETEPLLLLDQGGAPPTPVRGVYLYAQGNQAKTLAADGTIKTLGSGVNQQRFSIKDTGGAKGDVKRVRDAAMAAGTATVTSATAVFTSADVGKLMFLAGAGTSFTVGGATTTTGSNVVTGLSSMTSVIPGSRISGTGIPANTTIQAITTSPNQVLLSADATVSGSTTVTVVGVLSTSITAFGSATSVTVANTNGGSNVAAAEMYFGTDDSAARDTTIATIIAAGGGILYYPPGNYFHSTTNTITVTGVSVDGAGPGEAQIIRTAGVKMFEWQGSRVQTYNLTADVAKGATTLAYDTSGTKAGDYLLLRHGIAGVTTHSTSNGNFGEMVQCQTVNSTTKVTLYAETIDTYQTAYTARVDPVVTIKAPSLSNISFSSIGPLTTDEQIGYVSFRLCHGAIVENVVCERADQYSIQFDASVHSFVDGIYLRDTYYGGSFLGYGILQRGPAQWLTVIGAQSRNSQIFNNGGTLEGIPRFAYVQATASQGDPGLGDQKAAVSTHSDGEYFTFDLDAHDWNDIAIFLKGNKHFARVRLSNCKTVGVFLPGDGGGTSPISLTGITSTGSPDTFTKTAHGLVTGMVIMFSTVTGGTGISTTIPYWVINPTANTFQIALTPDGAAVDLSSDMTAGTVDMFVIPQFNTVVVESCRTMYTGGSSGDGSCIVAHGWGHALTVRDARYLDGHGIRCNRSTTNEPAGGHTIEAYRVEKWGRADSAKAAVSLATPVIKTQVLVANGVDAPNSQVVKFDNGTSQTGCSIERASGRNVSAVLSANEAWAIKPKVWEFTNGPNGVATLATGTVTVTNSSVTASTRITLTRQAVGGTAGHLSVTITAGTSFTINSTSGTETSTVFWQLSEPG